ncbi:MAG: hypothetical protein JST18_08385 [Bacteroidetes bacterium]|nr:hypothetical protein [Bacteroidota bacterium]
MKHLIPRTLWVLLIPLWATSQSVNYSDSIITRPASYKYGAEAVGRLLLGNHYREVWSAPISMKYLDLEHLYGGLTPGRRGGGFQTKSLRLMAPDSSEYVIRTIDKDPSKTVDAAFRNTIVTDLVQDQISASHPYGFMVVPGLAKAAGVYHSNPQVFYVPDDPRLGVHREVFKNEVVLFEERKLNSASVEEGLSGFTKVKDTWDVYDALHKNADNRVDEKFVLRSRLFDMMIGDWDRHEDQWQWAQFNLDDGTKMFRPIPRDRDQAFFNFDGILPTFASMNVATTRKMQRYKPMPVSVKWFNQGARYFDHNFLTRMTRDDWHAAADSLMSAVSDQEIESAFRAWPDTVYKLSAPEILPVIKERRNNLPLIADKFYSFLAKNVTIVGTNKQDYFEVKREEPNATDITVYQFKNGQKGRAYYHRLFTGLETKKIQLYGLDGNDIFHVEGKSGSNSVIRIIGGEGNDTIADLSKVGGMCRSTKVFDSREGNFLSLGSEAKNKTSDDTLLNMYSTKSFEYNSNFFFPLFGYNPDDGVFIGAGVTRITNGFKKAPCLTGSCYNTAPYASKQTVSFDIALKTGAFNFLYSGDFTDVIGKLDFNMQARIQAPNYRNNFFGYGNESVKLSDEKSYYRLHINQALLFPALEAGDENKVRFLFGPIYQYGNVKEDSSDAFFATYPDLRPSDLNAKHFLGGNTQFTYDPFVVDSMPNFEVRFLVNAGYLTQVADTFASFGFVRGYVSLYYHFYGVRSKQPWLTLATRLGGGYNTGDFTERDFQFYQGNVIGGRSNENVRGFLGERYTGKSSFYNNLEARLRLFHFNAYIFPADFGIIGLLDNGRVWVQDDSSSVWHTGYGGGIYLNPFGIAVLSATYTFSKDETAGLLNIKLGWWF